MENYLLKILKEENGQSYKVLNKRLVNIRLAAAEKYSWGIPNNNALNEISKYQPITEIGAGLGYWSKLLQDRGVNIFPFDIDLPSKDERWTTVYKFYKKTNINPYSSLMMCWIPKDISIKISNKYNGNIILWIGESIKFNNFEIKNIIQIPKWNGFQDCLYIFKRNINPN
jgi:hypothetical protein